MPELLCQEFAGNFLEAAVPSFRCAKASKSMGLARCEAPGGSRFTPEGAVKGDAADIEDLPDLFDGHVLLFV
ncbi:hypothetical protein [Arthrobacter sp. GCM10027362]|uniref:hypothetical protein n=1 Tax=Arthrobacter sp. GCM10027362 TaxID=3273379 RepID=UPI00366E2059